MADPSYPKGFICFVVIASSLMLLCFSSNAASDVPFIVAHKKAILDKPKAGPERISVTIDIYNQGSSTAFDLSLTDDSWPSDAFDVIRGSTSKSWERLDAGDILSHKFILEAKAKGVFPGKPAVIKFRIPTKTSLQEAFSTHSPPLDILAEIPSEKKLDLAKRLLAEYGSLIFVISIVILFVYLLITPSKSSAKGSNKKKR